MKNRGATVILAVVVLLLLVGAIFYTLQRSEPFKLGNEATVLESYVKETLQPSYLPQQLTVTHKLIDAGEAKGTNYTYGALWDIGGGKVYAFLHYTVNLTALSDLGVLIELNQTVALNEATASEMLKKYLSGSYAVKCDSGPNSTVICEDFTVSRGVEQGVGVLTLPSAKLTIVFSCKHFKGGELFGMGTCIKRR